MAISHYISFDLWWQKVFYFFYIRLCIQLRNADNGIGSRVSCLIIQNTMRKKKKWKREKKEKRKTPNRHQSRKQKFVRQMFQRRPFFSTRPSFCTLSHRLDWLNCCDGDQRRWDRTSRRLRMTMPIASESHSNSSRPLSHELKLDIGLPCSTFSTQQPKPLPPLLQREHFILFEFEDEMRDDLKQSVYWTQ